MANETTTSTLAQIQKAELINKYIQTLNRATPLGRMLAWEAKGVMSVAYRFPTWSSFSVSGSAKTQGTGDFGRVAMTTAETSATPAYYGMEVVLTDEALLGAQAEGFQAVLAIVEEAVREMENKLDQDCLAVSTSATSISGAVTDACTGDRLLSALQTFKELNNTGAAHVVLGNTAAGDLKKELYLSTATALGQSDVFSQPLTGAYLGTWGGAHIWESSNVANADSGTNNSNLITCMGPFVSGIGLVMGQEIQVAVSRDRQGELNKTQSLVFSMGHAAAMTRADKITEFLTT